jgi:hypothetical protein
MTIIPELPKTGFRVLSLLSRSYALFLAVVMLVSGFCSLSHGTVTIYGAPSGAPQSTKFSATVNGQALFVYDARCTDYNSSYAPFDLSSGDVANIVVTVPSGFSSVTIRPKIPAVSYTTAGNTISFTITNPVKLAITLNGSLSDPFSFSPIRRK